MKTKIVRLGDQLALVLPHEPAIMLGLSQGRSLAVERLDDGSIRAGPHDPNFDGEMPIAEDVTDKCAETFAALAKG